LLGASVPVPRFAAIVSNCEDSDGGWRFEIHNMIWEASSGNPPDLQALGNTWDRSPSTGPSHYVAQRDVNSLEELHAESWPLIVIPTAGLVELRLRPRARCGSVGSPPRQATRDALAHIVPRVASGLASDHASGATLYFLCPGAFGGGLVGKGRLLKTGEQFGGDISAFFSGQRQGFAQQLLGSRCHEAIVSFGVCSPTKALQADGAEAAPPLNAQAVRQAWPG